MTDSKEEPKQSEAARVAALEESWQCLKDAIETIGSELFELYNLGEPISPDDLDGCRQVITIALANAAKIERKESDGK